MLLRRILKILFILSSLLTISFLKNCLRRLFPDVRVNSEVTSFVYKTSPNEFDAFNCLSAKRFRSNRAGLRGGQIAALSPDFSVWSESFTHIKNLILLEPRTDYLNQQCNFRTNRKSTRRPGFCNCDSRKRGRRERLSV